MRLTKDSILNTKEWYGRSDAEEMRAWFIKQLQNMDLSDGPDEKARENPELDVPPAYIAAAT